MSDAKFVTAADINREKERIESAITELLNQFEKDCDGIMVAALDMKRHERAYNVTGEKDRQRVSGSFEIRLHVEID